jgi:hypothetical protein
MADAHKCDYAFLDQNGKLVDIRRDVRDVIDNYLAKLPFVAQWAREEHGYGYSAPKTSKRFPYRLHILTISPVVVLAVPTIDAAPPCSGPEMFSVGCWPAARFYPVPYLYKQRPKVVVGSFWFKPASSDEIAWLPNDAKTYSIPLQDSVLTLDEENGSWAVHRSRGRNGK